MSLNLWGIQFFFYKRERIWTIKTIKYNEVVVSPLIPTPLNGIYISLRFELNICVFNVEKENSEYDMTETDEEM